MNQKFLCPKCRNSLNNKDGSLVILKGRLECSHFSYNFEVGLPAQLGVYGATLPEGLVLKKGAEVTFMCTHCGADLTVPEAKHLAAIFMQDKNDALKIVVFNKIYGEHSSFVFDLNTRALIASYGEDQERWLGNIKKDVNFLGL